MANKRTLKRAINQICEGLFEESVAAALYGNGGGHDNADSLLFSIIKTQKDFLSRVSHPEPGLSKNYYYKKLREDFAAQVSDIVDHINNM